MGPYMARSRFNSRGLGPNSPPGPVQALGQPSQPRPAWPRPGPGLRSPNIGLLRPIWAYMGLYRAIIGVFGPVQGYYRAIWAYISLGPAWPGPYIQAWLKAGYKHIPGLGTLGPARIGLNRPILGLPAWGQPGQACIRAPEASWEATRALQGQ